MNGINDRDGGGSIGAEFFISCPHYCLLFKKDIQVHIHLNGKKLINIILKKPDIIGYESMWPR